MQVCVGCVNASGCLSSSEAKAAFRTGGLCAGDSTLHLLELPRGNWQCSSRL